MPLYTFYPCKPDGTAISLEAVELASDADAIAFADKLFDDHATCAFVAIWDDERAVSTCHRATASSRGAPTMAAADDHR